MMNQSQKDAIRSLRSAGWSFQAIAAHCKLAKSTVASFCKREQITPDTESQASVSTRCAQCGKELTPDTQGKKRFCSEKCRLSWWKAHPEQLKRKAFYSGICAHCGESFQAYGNNNRKYCSHACYIADRFGGERRE
ncbi:hypothetical protein [Actinotignum urinale]|uniref:hypothetical protein n=1 Tax=Actinotignum urinale TaxID=190146 RepID=UPI0003B557F2|nr:hypothetical protein [Actinotignum urinale]MDY5159631.1 RNA polymerase subunit sigma-70 [Actinotignum urinale]